MRRLLLSTLILASAAAPPAVTLAAGPASAQTPAPPSAPAGGALPLPDSGAPLEITSDGTLEGHRADKQYLARGNAVARQGTTSIKGDMLTADYRETAASKTDIYRLTATGNVRIDSEGHEGYADKAVYDVDRAMAVMTGDALRLQSATETLTAQDRFEYWVNEGRLTAYGTAKVVRGTDTLQADTMSAYFSKDPATGKQALSRFTADGHVTIITPTEIVTGEKGVYEAGSNTATLTGNVLIKRGPNTLAGAVATVNLTTGISTMQGTGEEGKAGRVKAIFYPGSEKTGPADAPAEEDAAPDGKAGTNESATDGAAKKDVEEEATLVTPEALTAADTADAAASSAGQAE